jgi:hypothetical protein
MEIKWTDEESARIREAHRGEGGLDAAGAMAVSLFLDRASGQVKEDVQRLRFVLEGGQGFVAKDAIAAAWPGFYRLAALAQEAERFEVEALAHAQEIETLRAKVAELEERRTISEAAWRQEVEAAQAETRKAGEQWATARAEVERLKVEVARLDMEKGLALQEAEDSESRLAVIRERSGNGVALHRKAEAGWCGVKDWDDAVHRDVRAANALPYLHYAANAVASWVLEGDAPQEAKDERPGCARFEHCENGDHDPACPRSKLHPCSSACTHDDAAKPGHPERVNKQSAEVVSVIGFTPKDDAGRRPEDDATFFRTIENGVEGTLPFTRTQIERYSDKKAEAMRAACWAAAKGQLEIAGIHETDLLWGMLKAAIEGAAS